VLPILRRRGGGKIIQISSLAARRPGPMLSLYAAAKAAVEAYSLALRFEVREFGIWVTAIGMSSVKSDIGRNRVAVEDRGTEYEPLGARVRARFARVMSSPAESEEVTAVIERLIADPEPPYRTYVGEEVTRIVAELSQQSDEAYEEALFAELGVDGRKQGRQC
jgi:NAD(P)-dependent dehydrogenase (short-subunit alcohol dehydrogenase family)